jgi:integrase
MALFASLKLRHIDVEQGFLDQDARDVRTKFSKTIATVFFPVSEVARRVVVEWVDELRTDLKWGADDPLFPATEIEVGEVTRQFEVTGLQRQCWYTTAPIRRIFREAFVAAGLPYFNPHSFRRTLAILAQRHCRTIEEFKAWSQNLGHEGAMTTLTSYGQIPIARQAELIRKMADRGGQEHGSPEWLRQFLSSRRMSLACEGGPSTREMCIDGRWCHIQPLRNLLHGERRVTQQCLHNRSILL